MLPGEPELRRIDERFIAFTRRHGAQILRWTLGIVFVWFGALKVMGASPVADFVAATVPWVPKGVLLPALGTYEIVVGIGLIVGLFPRIVLALFWAQMAGTFLTFVVQPSVMFVGWNPFLLTVEGEFVVKNLVLIAAGVVLAGTVKKDEKTGAARLGKAVPRRGRSDARLR